MKRFALLATILVAPLCLAPAHAAGCTATLAVGDASGLPGSSGIPVSVRVTTNQATRGIQVDIVDGTTDLTLTSCQSLVSGWNCPSTGTYGVNSRILFWTFSLARLPVLNNVEIARLVYKVSPFAASRTIPLVVSGLMVADTYNQACAVTGVNGSFTITGASAGVVVDDGVPF